MQSNNLIEVQSDWEEHWVNMPEFIQEKKEPYATIIIRVGNKSDLDALSVALGQKLTDKTKSAWFPFKSHWGDGKKPHWTGR